MADKAVAFDFERMTVEELTSVIDAAEVKRREKLDDARKALIAEFSDKASQLGLTLESLLPAVKGSSSRKPHTSNTRLLPVKFRGPDGEGWSGRGRAPTWLKKAEKEGRTKEDFRI